MFGPETFVERVADDGMAPRISRGDYVYVDPDEPAVDGSVVLFGRGADAVVRRLVVEAGRLRGRACVRPTGEQGSQGASVAERRSGHVAETGKCDVMLNTSAERRPFPRFRLPA